jgi:hypothetical protein
MTLFLSLTYVLWVICRKESLHLFKNISVLSTKIVIIGFVLIYISDHCFHFQPNISFALVFLVVFHARIDAQKSWWSWSIYFMTCLMRLFDINWAHAIREGLGRFGVLFETWRSLKFVMKPSVKSAMFPCLWELYSCMHFCNFLGPRNNFTIGLYWLFFVKLWLPLLYCVAKLSLRMVAKLFPFLLDCSVSLRYSCGICTVSILCRTFYQV